MKAWPISLIAAAALAFTTAKAYEWRWRVESTPASAMPPAASFTNRVAAVGLVEPASENIAISTAVPGVVTMISVKVGNRVRRGQALFSLDDRDLRAELVVRMSNLEIARARFQRLLQSPRPEELPKEEARVREAESVWADADTQLRLIESVGDRRAVREEEVLHRRETVRAALARLEEARAALALLKAGTWQRDLDVGRAEIASAEAAVSRVEADLDRLTVRAPIDGTILQVKIRPGEYAPVGELARPLLVMGDVDQLCVRVDIDENDLWRLQAGSKAEAVERGNRDRRAELEFVRFEPYVIPKKSLTGDSSERVDTRVLQAIYKFRKPVAGLYIGQQMDIFIEARDVQ